MSKNTQERYLYTQNRELSWLEFNKRVLLEARDERVPLLERLKFISIFSSNLDEFFMVRVGSLFDINNISPDELDNKTGWNAKEELDNIYATVPSLLTLKETIYSTLMEKLSKKGVKDISSKKLKHDEKKELASFFKKEVLDNTSYIILSDNSPLPHLINKRLYLFVALKTEKGEEKLAIVRYSDKLAPFYLMSNKKGYIRLEKLIEMNLKNIFPNYEIVQSSVFTITRNADISFDDEKYEDREDNLRRTMTKMLKERDYLPIVRLELNSNLSNKYQRKLEELCKIESYQTFIDFTPLNMHFVFPLIASLDPEKKANLLYSTFVPRFPENLSKKESMIKTIRKSDHMLFYPYDSSEPFLNLLKEASKDERVKSIKITIYRLASSSVIAKILSRAAKNGKEVLVLMELRARFDEENNLTWSKKMEKSGCRIIYGKEGFKCHSKICLITLEENGEKSYITQIGTGNYNEKTMTMYTDFSLMTASSDIGNDANNFFLNMENRNLEGKYNNLAVSPFGIKNMLMRKIDEEISHSSDGYILIKANSITERDIIDKLMEASQKGVKIDLIIRGICCILPSIKGFTDNIRVISIVGRFLEHGRVYIFGKGERESLYISSADLMTRNLQRRVEIAAPIFSEEIKKELYFYLDKEKNDSRKGSILLSNGSYLHLDKGKITQDSQNYFMSHSLHNLKKK